MPTQPTTVVVDQARHLLVHSADIQALEQWVGSSWIDCATARSERALVAFLWAGMRWREPKITQTEVSERLDTARANGVTLAKLWDGIGDMLVNSGFLPRAAPSENGDRPPVPGLVVESSPRVPSLGDSPT